MEAGQGSAHNILFVTKLTTARHLGYSHKQIFFAKRVYVILMDQVSINLTGYSGSLVNKIFIIVIVIIYRGRYHYYHHHHHH